MRCYNWIALIINKGTKFMRRFICIILTMLIWSSVSWLAFAAEGKELLPSGIAYSDIEAVIDAYVKKHEKTTAAVSVAIFTDSRALMEKAYGYSNLENSIINDKDTVFEWGSCTKLLVWTSVMQLAEKGKLDLKEDIRTYLPKGFLKKLKNDTPITMINLMNHNGGWQETVTDLFVDKVEDVKELGDVLKQIEPEQINKPGEIVAYSNWSSALAGYIVERVSGQSFYEYVHQNIFEPLGMEHTALSPTLSDNEWVAEKRAKEKCYTDKKEPLGTSLYHISMYPAGMATGTLSDFIRFAQTFSVSEGEKLMLFEKRDTLEEMLSPTLFYADGSTARNYHGFWTDQFRVPVLWHNGGTLGSSSWFAFDPKSGIGMITLTNQRNESIYNCGLLPLVFGKYESISKVDTGSNSDISGMYVSARSCFKSFAKPYNLFSTMGLELGEDAKYTIPGTNSTLKAIGKDSYLMDQGDLKQFIVHASTDKDGRTTLQLPGSDYIKVNGYVVLAKYGLLLMFLLAVLYGFFALIVSFVNFLRRKNSLGRIGRVRTAVNASVIVTAIMFGYITVKLSSEVALRENIIWSVVMNAVLAFIPVTYTFILFTRWKKLQCTRKEKIKLIVTAVAGLIMTINVFYWEAYKFW